MKDIFRCIFESSPEILSALLSFMKEKHITRSESDSMVKEVKEVFFKSISSKKLNTIVLLTYNNFDKGYYGISTSKIWTVPAGRKYAAISVQYGYKDRKDRMSHIDKKDRISLINTETGEILQQMIKRKKIEEDSN